MFCIETSYSQRINKKNPRKPYTDDDAVTTMAIDSIAEHPRSSLRQRAPELNVSPTLLQTIYKTNKMYP